ncbi:MAG: NUDIX hydrolase [Bacteroidetes bacterium]|nr:NUDIX hydrolase [Bacteroidota bacterium]
MFLLQYNAHHKVYNFISGHFDPEKDSDFLAAMVREVEEELPGLRYQKDFTVYPISDEPFTAIHFSARYKVDTKYEFHLFQFQFLKTPSAYSYLWVENTNNKWFSLDEILKGQGNKGEPVSTFPIIDLHAFLEGGFAALPLSYPLNT